MRSSSGLRVGEHAERGLFSMIAHQRFQHAGGVASAAAAGIVLRVRDHDRPRRFGTDCHGLAHRLVGIEQRLRERLLHAVDVIGETVRRRIHRRLRIAMRDDAGAAVVQV